MAKKLVKHGKSQALIIPKKILMALGINENSSLELAIDNDKLVITVPKKKTSKREPLSKFADRVMTEYEPVFKKLAKT